MTPPASIGAPVRSVLAKADLPQTIRSAPTLAPPVETAEEESLRVAASVAVASDTMPIPIVALPVAAPACDVTDDLRYAASAPVGGRRRAARRASHTGSRGSLFKGLPSAPALLGVAALAISIGGVVLVQEPELASSADQVQAASAMGGTSAAGVVDAGRGSSLSRDSSRSALAQASDGNLVAAAERRAVQRDEALGALAQQAEVQADKLAENRWVLPLDSYRLTAEFGDVGLWATYHTGLDFAAPSGTPIRAVAGGVVTSAGYDGSYGNKTVITLEDGTELWYCHQTSFGVSAGDTVAAGELIGYVGSTGNVTGPHLHLEVRPGGGDPVDPYTALIYHGLQH